MEELTTIKQIYADYKIFVPVYKRIYFWDTELESSNPAKQVNAFFSDIENCNRSLTKSKYSFGHFLFEERGDNKYAILDGQHRLITIVSFVAAIFRSLKKIRSLNKEDEEIYQNFINCRSKFSHETIDCQYVKNIIISHIKNNRKGLKYDSTIRILKAYGFLSSMLEDKEEAYLRKMLDTIINASCTTSLSTGTRKRNTKIDK